MTVKIHRSHSKWPANHRSIPPHPWPAAPWEPSRPSAGRCFQPRPARRGSRPWRSRSKQPGRTPGAVPGRQRDQKVQYVWRSIHRGTPSYHPFLIRIFPSKASSYGGTPWLWKLPFMGWWLMAPKLPGGRQWNEPHQNGMITPFNNYESF